MNDIAGKFTPSAIVDRAGDLVVSKGISNVFQGQDFFQGFDQLAKTFLVTEALAITQFGIGELGAGNANFEGSIGHLLLHGVTGCGASKLVGGDCSAGFAAGVGQSILAGTELSDQQKARLVPIVSGFAGFVFSDGKAINVTFASRIGVSGFQNNYLTHAEAKERRALLLKNSRTAADDDRLLELQQIDQDREDNLQDCRGSNSARCQGIRQQLRLDLAEYITENENGNYTYVDENGVTQTDNTYAFNRGLVIARYGEIYGDNQSHGDISGDQSLSQQQIDAILNGITDPDVQSVALSILNGEELPLDLVIHNASLVGTLDPAAGKSTFKSGATNRQIVDEQRIPSNGGSRRVSHAKNSQSLIGHNANPIRQGTVIKGGHNEQSFNTLAASDQNINVGTTTQLAPGIKSVEYTVTKTDGSTSTIRTKTVYDPNVYSDQQIADMSSTAISQAPIPSTGSNLSKTVVNSVEFTVTRDPAGSVNNVFISGPG